MCWLSSKILANLVRLIGQIQLWLSTQVPDIVASFLLIWIVPQINLVTIDILLFPGCLLLICWTPVQTCSGLILVRFSNPTKALLQNLGLQQVAFLLLSILFHYIFLPNPGFWLFLLGFNSLIPSLFNSIITVTEPLLFVISDSSLFNIYPNLIFLL